MDSAPATGPASRSTRASRRAAERIMGSLRPGAYQSGGPFLAATGIEARHGFPGTRRALGGVGGHFGAPHVYGNRGMTSRANSSIERRILSWGRPPKFIQQSTWPTPIE